MLINPEELQELERMPYGTLRIRCIATVIQTLGDQPYGVDMVHKRLVLVSALARLAAREKLADPEELALVVDAIRFVLPTPPDLHQHDASDGA